MARSGIIKIRVHITKSAKPKVDVMIYFLIALSCLTYAQLSVKGLENLENPFAKKDRVCDVSAAYKEGRNEAAETRRFVPSPSQVLMIGHGCEPDKSEEMKASYIKGAKEAETLGKLDESIKIEIDADLKQKIEEQLPSLPAEKELVPTQKTKHNCAKGINGIQCGWNCITNSLTKIPSCGQTRNDFCYENSGVVACGKKCRTSIEKGVICDSQ